MRDAPPFVLAAEELARRARVVVQAICTAVAAKDGASPAERTALVATARALREHAAELDNLVGRVEGVIAARHAARKP